MKFPVMVLLVVACGLCPINARSIEYEDYEAELLTGLSSSYDVDDYNSLWQYMESLKQMEHNDYADENIDYGLHSVALSDELQSAKDYNNYATTSSEVNDNDANKTDDDNGADDNEPDDNGNGDNTDADNDSYTEVYDNDDYGGNAEDDIQEVADIVPLNGVDTSDDSSELTAKNAYSLTSANLLAQVSLTSKSSAVLATTYFENVADFSPIYNKLRDSIFMLYEQNEQISEDFLNTAAARSEYNGQVHKKLVTDMSAMLTKLDEIRSNILQMQNVEQRLNYHLLLKALVKEIYGEKSATMQRYAAQYP